MRVQTQIVQLHSQEEICATLARFADTLPSLSKGEAARQAFAEKFCQYATVVELRNADKIVAFAAFYCNDLQNKCAYLSMIAVLPEARGCGWGKLLLNQVCKMCREAGMSKLQLEVSRHNEVAKSLYKAMGFLSAGTETPTSVYLMREL